ncbi:TIM-barrel domain-containing protein [Sodaliphilus sp.]|uniref:glycoside hydrolase family 31 protein n=1 Tax=Sodaliphilus sp. TaxID=2815818 RepID=UPI00388FC14B
MKNFVLSAIVALGAIFTASAVNNVAYQDATVRFTVITDGAVRMEYAPDGKFVDDKSFVAVERDYAPVKYTVKDGSWVEITTPKMKLRYKKGSGAFTEKNTEIKGVKGAFLFTWKPGMKQQANLKGTYRTLDRCLGDVFSPGKEKVKLPVEDGVIARDGWTLIDDSKNFLFDGNTDWDWVKERKAADGAQDWYFMAYGNDYKKALGDYATFAGKMPLPPRYVFGYWWSRYWAYSDQEMRDLIDKMDAYQIPIDVLVVDMDWHYTDNVRGGWTGFTWNKSLFPEPNKFLNYLRDKGLKITLNLHPADGVMTWEEKYPEMCAEVGMNPAEKKNIPWWGSRKDFTKGLFKHILNPMEKEGVDFWWLDWQQYPNDLLVDGLSNTWWINYTFFTQQEKFTNKRPLLYHRWGGLGNHRYQIGFSGDTYMGWKSLDYQPYFNHTASNVLYGFWSHDIGGHMLGLGDDIAPEDAMDHVDPELYIRWMQFGALSPVLRTHSTKDNRLEKEPWAFGPEVTDVLRDIIQQRYRMAPYIYTTARQAHDTSISMCRPMYYDYPGAEEAYQFKNQYMFGDDMMIAPVTSPATNGFTTIKVWLPEGKWYEMVSGTMLDGGQVVERDFALDEYPIYVKAGAVLPFTGGKVKNLTANDDPVEVTVFPGGNGEFKMYEDAGVSKNYETECAWTALSSKREDARLTVNIAPRQGKYAGMAQNRDFSVRVLCSEAPASVTVNGQKADYTYDAKELAVVVKLPKKACGTATEVVLNYAGPAHNLADGTIGRAKRVVKTINEFKSKCNPGRLFNDEVADLGSFYVGINYNPENVIEWVNKFNTTYNNLPEVFKTFGDNDRAKADAQWIFEKINYKK